VIENSDIAGFSQQQQQFLAALVRTHRRRLHQSDFDALPDRLLPAARRLAALLRVAVVLHRGRDSDPIPELGARAENDRLVLTLAAPWYDSRPLLKADLQGEQAYFPGLGIGLDVEAL